MKQVTTCIGIIILHPSDILIVTTVCHIETRCCVKRFILLKCFFNTCNKQIRKLDSSMSYNKKHWPVFDVNKTSNESRWPTIHLFCKVSYCMNILFMSKESINLLIVFLDLDETRFEESSIDHSKCYGSNS